MCADSPLCQKDAILIHDGINAAASRLKTICGTGGDPVTVSVVISGVQNLTCSLFTKLI